MSYPLKLTVSTPLPYMKRAKLSLPRLTNSDIAKYDASLTPTGGHRSSKAWLAGQPSTTCVGAAVAAAAAGEDTYWVMSLQHPSLKVPKSSSPEYTPEEIAKLNGSFTLAGTDLAKEISLVDGEVSRLAEIRVRRKEKMNLRYRIKQADRKLDLARLRIDRARILKFHRRRHAAALRLVQKAFDEACQVTFGIVPMGDSFDAIPTPGVRLGESFIARPQSMFETSHGDCIYCHCHCPEYLKGDGNAQTAADQSEQCEHCRYYKTSHARRCFGELGNRSGSIAYILRHSFLHRPELGTAPVEESFIAAVTAAFRKYPVSSEAGEDSGRLSALSTEYEQWIKDTNSQFRWPRERESTARYKQLFNARQRRNFLIMTQTFSFNDAVFWDGYGRLTSIIEAATLMMDVHHNIPPSFAKKDPHWYHGTLNLAAINMKMRNSIRPGAMQLSFSLPEPTGKLEG